MRIATWNVNSIRARLPHLIAWLGRHGPDVVALQETKVADERFPRAEIEATGYRVACAGQKAYNGVALLARMPVEVLDTTLPGMDDGQRRLLAARLGALTVVNVYVPNGAAVGTDKYDYKLMWLDRLQEYLAGLQRERTRLVVLGDFNIAPTDRDVHDPRAWEGSVMVSEPERERLRWLLALGLQDLYRLHDGEEAGFTWWDYRGAAFRRNHGLRIDLVLAAEDFAARCRACTVDREPRGWDRPSDHAPVVAELDIGDEGE